MIVPEKGLLGQACLLKQWEQLSSQLKPQFHSHNIGGENYSPTCRLLTYYK